MVAASSKGLGFGIARELAKNGAVVCIASRTKTEIEKASENLRKETGATIHTSVFDASSAESIKNWITEVETAFERINGLVVNAGGPPPGNFDDFTDEDWLAAFNLTLMSAVRLIRGVLPGWHHAILRRGSAAFCQYHIFVPGMPVGQSVKMISRQC
jgi:3-oxoacyl-[acyl-carrier protein] reductase